RSGHWSFEAREIIERGEAFVALNVSQRGRISACHSHLHGKLGRLEFDDLLGTESVGQSAVEMVSVILILACDQKLDPVGAFFVVGLPLDPDADHAIMKIAVAMA